MEKKAIREPLNGTVSPFLASCRLKAAPKLLPVRVSWICFINSKTIPPDNTLVSVHQCLVAGIFHVLEHMAQTIMIRRKRYGDKGRKKGSVVTTVARITTI